MQTKSNKRNYKQTLHNYFKKQNRYLSVYIYKTHTLNNKYITNTITKL